MPASSVEFIETTNFSEALVLTHRNVANFNVSELTCSKDPEESLNQVLTDLLRENCSVQAHESFLTFVSNAIGLNHQNNYVQGQYTSSVFAQSLKHYILQEAKPAFLDETALGEQEARRTELLQSLGEKDTDDSDVLKHRLGTMFLDDEGYLCGIAIQASADPTVWRASCIRFYKDKSRCAIGLLGPFLTENSEASDTPSDLGEERRNKEKFLEFLGSEKINDLVMEVFSEKQGLNKDALLAANKALAVQRRALHDTESEKIEALREHSAAFSREAYEYLPLFDSLTEEQFESFENNELKDYKAPLILGSQPVPPTELTDKLTFSFWRRNAKDLCLSGLGFLMEVFALWGTLTPPLSVVVAVLGVYMIYRSGNAIWDRESQLSDQKASSSWENQQGSQPALKQTDLNKFPYIWSVCAAIGKEKFEKLCERLMQMATPDQILKIKGEESESESSEYHEALPSMDRRDRSFSTDSVSSTSSVRTLYSTPRRELPGQACQADSESPTP